MRLSTIERKRLRVRKKLKSVSKDSILAIGDGLNTDIAGASNFGIDSFFIINGVH